MQFEPAIEIPAQSLDLRRRGLGARTSGSLQERAEEVSLLLKLVLAFAKGGLPKEQRLQFRPQRLQSRTGVRQGFPRVRSCSSEQRTQLFLKARALGAQALDLLLQTLGFSSGSHPFVPTMGPGDICLLYTSDAADE